MNRVPDRRLLKTVRIETSFPMLSIRRQMDEHSVRTALCYDCVKITMYAQPHDTVEADCDLAHVLTLIDCLDPYGQSRVGAGLDPSFLTVRTCTTR